MTDVLVEMLARETPSNAMRAYFAAAAQELAEAGFLIGCPVPPIIMDFDDSAAALAAVCRDAITNWCELYEKGLLAAGMTQARARGLAILY